ncbi:hypothetical protein QCD79_32660, partial [Pseudomonas quasicaspiana]|nr:hypothetical protein [Pseudomonas quasicaspiana]
LGTWDTQVTVTTPEDIGKLTAQIIFAEPRLIDQVVYVKDDLRRQLTDVLWRGDGDLRVPGAQGVNRIFSQIDHP